MSGLVRIQRACARTQSRSSTACRRRTVPAGSQAAQASRRPTTDRPRAPWSATDTAAGLRVGQQRGKHRQLIAERLARGGAGGHDDVATRCAPAGRSPPDGAMGPGYLSCPARRPPSSAPNPAKRRSCPTGGGAARRGLPRSGSPPRRRTASRSAERRSGRVTAALCCPTADVDGHDSATSTRDRHLAHPAGRPTRRPTARPGKRSAGRGRRGLGDAVVEVVGWLSTWLVSSALTVWSVELRWRRRARSEVLGLGVGVGCAGNRLV